MTENKNKYPLWLYLPNIAMPFVIVTIISFIVCISSFFNKSITDWQTYLILGWMTYGFSTVLLAMEYNKQERKTFKENDHG